MLFIVSHKYGFYCYQIEPVRTEVNVTAEFLCNMTLLLLTPFCRRSIKLTVTLSRTISLIIAVVKTQANSEERRLIAARGCIVVSNN